MIEYECSISALPKMIHISQVEPNNFPCLIFSRLHNIHLIREQPLRASNRFIESYSILEHMQDQRSLFDIPGEIAYFNTAYFSPLLNASRDRMITGLNQKIHPWERHPEDFFDDANRVRELAAGLFGGDAEGYAITPSASYGLSTAARAVEPVIQRGDIILVLAEDFPSAVLPWYRVAKERGAVLHTVPVPVDGNWTKAILDQLVPGIRVAAVTSCHWTNGAHVNLEAVGEACRRNDTILVVDATQSLGAMPLSMETVQPDFLAASGYKWLLFPYGASLLYVSARWRNARPLEESWITRANARDFAGLTTYVDAYLPGARRFDVGETCNPVTLPGAIAALEQLQAWGIPQIAETLEGINARLCNALQTKGFQVPDASHRSPHMFGAKLPATYTGNLLQDLRPHKIFLSQRGQFLRISPHLHINDHDMDRLLGVLEEAVRGKLH